MAANIRATAAIIIAKVAYSHQSLTQVLSQSNEAISGENASLLKALCFGTLRTFQRWEAIMDAAMTRPIKKSEGELRALIAVGLFQLIDSRVPAHAAISETVAATLVLKKKWAKGLVNALLRRVQREPEWCAEISQKTDSAKYCFPQWMLEKVKKDWPQHWMQIVAESNLQAPMTLRVNSLLNSRTDYLQHLIDAGINADSHPIAEDGIVLSAPMNVEQLPGFHQGWVSVQDASPQMTPYLLNLKPGLSVLDACAAPGGKTGHMLEKQPSLKCLALDVDANRLQRVTENLNRLSLKASYLEADAGDLDSWWKGELFDRIFLDAPCSGSGVIRRHPDIKLLRKPTDIAQLTSIQSHLLNQLWKTLAPGGRMLYSTCSIFRAENVHQITQFLSHHSDAVEITESVIQQNLPLQKSFSNANLKAKYGWQIMPECQQMDGFYYSILLKLDPDNPSSTIQS